MSTTSSNERHARPRPNVVSLGRLASAPSTHGVPVPFSRLVWSSEQTDESCLLEFLDRVQCGGIICSAHYDIVSANRTAIAQLRRASEELGTGTASQPTLVLLTLIAARSARRRDSDSTFPLMIELDAGWRLLIGSPPLRLPRGRKLLTIIDLDAMPRPSVAVLQQIWRLTLAEATVAAELTRGTPVAELAGKFGVSRTTLRTQLASVFAKTGTRRQQELVALLSRLILLA
jgi:DNA-binding CsgD family transcriptional regulator